MTQWIDLDNDPAPQWVGDMAVAEMNDRAYSTCDYFHASSAFHALCRRIYRTEAPPVDPDFERMKRAIAAYECKAGYPGIGVYILDGAYGDKVQAALDAWKETVAS